MKLQAQFASFNDFHLLLEYSQDVFWMRDIDYRKQEYVNNAYEKVWGRTCRSLYQDGLSWFSAVHPEDKLQVELEINQIKHNFSKGKMHELNYRIIRPSGEIRHIRESVYLFYDANRLPKGFMGIAKDITPQHFRLTEFEQGTKFFQLFAEKMHSVFWARDTTYNKQLYVSSGYEKIWGRNTASLYENPDSWLETLHPEDKIKCSDYARFNVASKEGYNEPGEHRYRIYRPDGEIRWIKDTSYPLQDENNKFIGFAGIAEDITKEVLHEQQLHHAIQRAEVANQAKSDFLAMVSHELRTPLNAILGMAQILKSRGLSKDLQNLVDIISNAGNDLLSLVSDFLDFVKLEAGKLSFTNEPFDIQELLTQIVDNLQYQATEKGLLLSLHFIGNPLEKVLGDAQRIRQIILNLLGNALKFTDDGCIKVNVHCIKQAKNKVFYEIAIADTGIGIHEDKLNLVFEKFSQVDSIYRRKHGGIGLGLAITKQLVETMGGEIYVKSEYGVGSEFRFTLPLTLYNEKKKVRNALKEKLIENIPRRQFGLEVLLVEDNVINQKIAKFMLEDFGCQVDILNNGKAVLNNLSGLLKYAVIFMDIGLPDISGFDIVGQIRCHRAFDNLPIVALTAHILDRDRQKAFESGMNRIIAKPISYKEIEVVLKELVDGERASAKP